MSLIEASEKKVITEIATAKAEIMMSITALIFSHHGIAREITVGGCHLCRKMDLYTDTQHLRMQEAESHLETG